MAKQGEEVIYNDLKLTIINVFKGGLTKKPICKAVFYLLVLKENLNVMNCLTELSQLAEI